MALSYNLGYQESISVHLTRRQIFDGKPYSNFPNIWQWLIYFHVDLFEEDDYDFDYEPRQMIPKHRLLLLERVNGTAPGRRFSCGFFYRRWKIYWIWWPQKPKPRIWTATDSCNPIRNHNVNRTSKKHTVNNHKREYFFTALMIPHLILHKASVKCRKEKAQEDSYQAGFKVFLSETITFNTRSMIWWSHQLSVFHVLM